MLRARWFVALVSISVLVGGGAVASAAETPSLTSTPGLGIHVAVGIPSEDVGSREDAGIVDVLIGSDFNPASNPSLQELEPVPSLTVSLRQGIAGLGGSPEAGDRFGAALAFGDFNGDQVIDLAVGAPGEDIAGRVDGGMVHVLHGAPGDPLGGSALTFHAGTPGVAGRLEGGDEFGASLAVADLNLDGFDDLAVGVPGEDAGGRVDVGAVQVFFGSADGLTLESTFYTQSTPGMAGSPEAGDRFGEVLAGRPGFDMLVVGVPFEDIGPVTDAGLVQIIAPSRPEVEIALHQQSRDVSGVAEAGDRFGAAVDIDPNFGNNIVDVAIGVPHEAIGSRVAAGLIHAVRFEDGLFDSANNPIAYREKSFTQSSAGLAGRAEADDRFGAAVAIRSGDFWATAPGEDFGSVADIGRTHGLGKPFSNAVLPDDGVHQGSAGVPGRNEAGDLFGSTLASSPRLLVLGIGASGEAIGPVPAAGAVTLRISDGQPGAIYRTKHQASAGVSGSPEANDQFGQVIAVW